MKKCRPEGECARQVYSEEFRVHGESASCALENDWWSIERYEHNTSHTEYFVGGCPCYTMATLNVNGSFGGGPRLWAQWIDPAGRKVAFNLNYPRGSVICGPFVTEPNDAFAPDGGLAPGFTEYPQDPDNPACAPWREPVCRRGCCPTNPPRLP